MNVLETYESRNGHTRQVAEAIATAARTAQVHTGLMAPLPGTGNAPPDDDAYVAASRASTARSSIDLSPRARRWSFWAAVIALASYGLYYPAVAWYAADGFSAPPPTMTRILASLSVFPSAPALVVLVAGLASRFRTGATVSARLAMMFTLVFAGLALTNRVSLPYRKYELKEGYVSALVCSSVLTTLQSGGAP